MSLHSVTIQGHEVSIGKFGAIEGWKMIHKLSKIMSPLFDGAIRGEISKAVGGAMASLSADEFITLIRELTRDVLIDGKKFTDKELGDYSLTLLVIVEVIKYNFAGFFSPITEALGDSNRT